MSGSIRLGALAAVVALASLPAAATSPTPRMSAPLKFFEGKTEMLSTVKVVFKSPYKSVTTGDGKILSDGSLSLVQKVRDENKPTESRHWRIKQVAAGRFAGTMTEAVGPVQAEEVGGKYRFRFKMKGNLSVEQWLTPLPGGRAAQSKISVRKAGIRVATSDGIIRRV
jgi:hypothetical protein